MNKPTFNPKNALLWAMCAIALVVSSVLIGRLTAKPSETEHPTSATSIDAPDNTKIAMTVQATTPSPMLVSDSLSASGVMSAKETAEVSAKITGATIEQVLVEVGDYVKAGQVLAVLDKDTMSENAVQAQADYEQARASREQAQADLARVEPLLAIDAVSRQQVDSYRTALKQAQATEKASLARLSTAKSNLNNTQIIAPVAGIISAKNAQVGVLVSGAPLFSVIKGGRLEWQATLSPADAERIHVGQQAQVMVGDESVAGTVTHLSPTANAGREIVVHVAMPAHFALRAGTYQRGHFVLGSQSHHAIPSSAVMSTDGYDYVWQLAKTDQTDIYQTRRQKITVLAREQDKVATDLPSDTLIVANGVSFLNENDLVNIVMTQDMAGDKAGQP
ncbi:efflux RND transporter periplasmic adaptor subunit [Moraxella bovis]|uniref:efflux RND transporter periplasmic adaptor subunit n=1 Tax=Moraxella bovis TaxID=476 RepID=UPI002225EA0B|nr:efflux RND transporter periplasmic adaptor subunit [Moraxella bovis]UYZ69180.1 efflux RND transporter periplasmic adaptor subunit [Moraxella bovis]UYZ71553.1 efflux RND transporter periplasmic adaptor subunit [Moraxella bovis]UYZ72533.1 efflux RND transporter periplasmic adaptor subunit [Moraxella bovis]UZA14848.1 efflux RND transporter periplasmic adaptor subunit [Moraxella bovis]UZA26790.1 efflux RND transporter periplasmic adaptor subunit [Moraxella bovis]